MEIRPSSNDPNLFNISKMYSKKYGALFLFADSYHTWSERKHQEVNLSKDLRKLKNFRSLILKFGVVCTLR